MTLANNHYNLPNLILHYITLHIMNRKGAGLRKPGSPIY